MNSNSMLLKSSLLLLAPAIFAYGSSDDESRSASPIAMGAEIFANKLDIGWNTHSTTKTQMLSQLTSAITNSSAFVYQDANDKQNYSFGGRLTGKTNISDDFCVMVGLGVEAGVSDASAYAPVDLGVTAGGGVTLAVWDTQSTTHVATWKTNMVIVPSMFVGYGNFALGVAYDMREYDITGHATTLKTFLDTTIKDNQILFGFRGEQGYDMDDMKLVLSYEAMSNFGAKAHSETEKYFADLMKYAPDNTVASPPFGTDGALDEGTYALPANRQTVASTYTNITKLTIGLGIQFAEF